MANLDDLLAEIYGGKKPAFYAEFESWLRQSRRFKAFAQEYRAKIHAKLKNARNEGGRKDLRAELETAALLLKEARFTLEYEKYAASKERGPDFTVTFKTHTLFNVEVRRIASLEFTGGQDIEARVVKLILVLLDKVGQMWPGMINLLWLITEGEIAEDDLARALVTLRQLAERKTDDVFTRYGFESAAHFLKKYQQLSGIVIRRPGGVVLWPNALAPHKVPPEIVTAIQRLGVAGNRS